MFAGQSSDATRKMPLEFVKAHYDELPKNNTGGIFGFGGPVPLVGISFCDSESRDELKNFFEPRVDRLPGGRLSLSKTLEGLDVCIATNAAQLQALTLRRSRKARPGGRARTRTSALPSREIFKLTNEFRT